MVGDTDVMKLGKLKQVLEPTPNPAPSTDVQICYLHGPVALCMSRFFSSLATPCIVMFNEAIPGDEDPSRLGGPAPELVVKTEQK